MTDMERPLDIRPMRAGDVHAIAYLHEQVFEDYFTTGLGQRFLERFYGEFVGNRDAQGFVATVGETVVGFVVGVTEPSSFYRRLYQKHFGALILMLSRALIIEKRVRRGILRRLRHIAYAIRFRFESLIGVSEYRTCSAIGARLLSVGVSPGARGRGIADELMLRFCDWLHESGQQWVGLSVIVGNKRAIGFYEKTGWQRERVVGETAYFYRSTSRDVTEAHRGELDRIRAEYARRANDAELSARYSRLNPASLFALHGRERVQSALFRAEGITSFDKLRILDVGCGSGGDIVHLLSYGASARNIHGVDLLAERLEIAARKMPHAILIQGDAEFLPYAGATFDIVMQSTVFSSILEPKLRKRIADEMLRVLAPEGLILWYDFLLNPLNRDTRGIRRREINQLFAGCTFSFRRVTLAPPIARIVLKCSHTACSMLEAVPFLRTHYLVGIRKAKRRNE